MPVKACSHNRLQFRPGGGETPAATGGANMSGGWTPRASTCRGDRGSETRWRRRSRRPGRNPATSNAYRRAAFELRSGVTGEHCFSNVTERPRSRRISPGRSGHPLPQPDPKATAQHVRPQRRHSQCPKYAPPVATGTPANERLETALQMIETLRAWEEEFGADKLEECAEEHDRELMENHSSETSGH